MSEVFSKQNLVLSGELKKQGVVRVAVSIPTMGYTHAEAYCNRLINFMHLGHLEEQGKNLRALKASIVDESEEVQARILKRYIESSNFYWIDSSGTTFEFFFSVVGRIFTPVARDEAVRLALESNCDYVYMVDDDMICQDDLFERLYRHNVDIVAALAFTRNAPHKPVMYTCKEGYDPVSRKDYFINTSIMNYPEDKLVECDAVGFGAVLIKTSVFKSLQKPYFMSTCGTGEDIFLCYKAKKAGFRVYMDTETKIGHLGAPINVTEDYVKKYNTREHPEYEKRYSNKYNKYGNIEPVCVIGAAS